MRWEDESYVRVYRRDTPEWLMLSWEARLVFNEVLKHCDRAGLLELGRHGARALAVVMRIPEDLAKRALDEWLEDGCVQMLDGGVLFVRNYREAQEARQSDKVRKQNERERAASDAKAAALGLVVTRRDEQSRGVTKSHIPSHGVTSCHTQNSAVLGQCSGSARFAGSLSADPPASANDASLTAPTGAEDSLPPASASEGATKPAIQAPPAPQDPPRRREPRQKPAPDPMHNPLKLRLLATYQAVRGAVYGFDGGADAKAVTRLLELSGHNPNEVDKRWRLALGMGRYPGCAELKAFASRWNEFAGTPNAQAPPGRGVKGFQDIDAETKRFHEQNAGKDIQL